MQKKALVAMSGGVDSSVGACLVKKAGYDTMGAIMKLTRPEKWGAGPDTACSGSSDIEDARAVAARLGIPFDVFDFSDEFEQEVVCRFVRAYEEGRTPNPCVDCNRHMKFDRFFRQGKELGYDYVATGHYARVDYDPGSGRYLLKKSPNREKDQSYVLYSLTQDVLARTLFPVGALDKEETRRIAAELGLVNAGKKESQDICFVPDGDYAGFIRRYTGKEYPPGDFVDEDGNVLGRHKGLIRYTIGQRKGLGLALKQPMYVLRKDIEENRVVLGKNEDLFSRTLEAGNFNWIACEPPESDLRANAKVRYSQKESSARVIPLGGARVRLEFDEPQRAITSGQAVVLYDGDVVVGGGTIL